MNELEVLVRDTLRTRAATVSDAPAWNGQAGRSRFRWLPAAAAAIVVVAVGGGAAVWHLSDSGTHSAATQTPTAAPPISSCAASLPAAWRTALAGHPVRAPGGAVAVPVAVTPDARTVVVWHHGGRSTFGVVATDGQAVRAVYEEPADRQVENLDVDAKTIVFGEIDRARASNGGPITAVVAVDLGTGRARTVLRPKPGQALAGSVGTGQFIQDGVIYWSLVRSGSRSGTVEAYTVRTGVTRVVGHTTGSDPALDRDVRGVSWHGGRVAARNPPPASAAGATEVVGDGTAFAWQPGVRGAPGTGQRIEWADHDVIRTVTVRGLPTQELALVGGPFVLLGVPSTRPLADGEPSAMHLLDVRTGALAPVTVPFGAQFAAAGRWTLTARTGILLVNTSRLPGLHC